LYSRLRRSRHTALLLTFVMAAGCAGLDSDPPLLTAETPLRLEKHIDVATIEASGVPTTFLRQSSGGSTNPNPSGSRSVFRKPAREADRATSFVRRSLGCSTGSVDTRIENEANGPPGVEMESIRPTEAARGSPS